MGYKSQRRLEIHHKPEDPGRPREDVAGDPRKAAGRTPLVVDLNVAGEECLHARGDKNHLVSVMERTSNCIVEMFCMRSL